MSGTIQNGLLLHIYRVIEKKHAYIHSLILEHIY